MESEKQTPFLQTDAASKRQNRFSMNGCRKHFVERYLLLVLTMVGVVLGFIIGFILQHYPVSDDDIMWLGLPGELYMRMLKGTILPLIISSVIAGTASLDPKSNGLVTGVALAYILLTNTFGAILGVILGVVIQPGSGQEKSSAVTQVSTNNLQTKDIFADLIRNLFPDNLIAACFQQSQTKYTIVERTITLNTSGGLVNESMTMYERSLGTSSGTNVLGLIIAATILGMAATKCGEMGQPFLKFFQSTCEIMIKVLHWIVWYTPIGVASLIAASVAQASDIEHTFRSLGMFVLTVTVGILIHQLVFIQLVYFIVIRRNPFKFYMSCFRPMVTAFAPPSTALAIPAMLVCLEGKHQVDKRITRFVVPFAATINRDGSAFFITVTAIYVGQVEGNLDAKTILMIAILATVGSIAVPAVPSSSIVIILIILSSLNINPANVGIIMALEWYTDRLRTTSNTLSICLCSVITFRIAKKWLTQDQPPSQIPNLEMNNANTSTPL